MTGNLYQDGATNLHLTPESIGRAYVDGHAWSVLEELTDIGNRMAGSPGESKAAELIGNAFEKAGLREVTTTSFSIDGWTRGSSMVAFDGEVHDGQHAVIGLPGSPADRVEAPLVDVGFGTREEIEATDCEGAIALASTGSPPNGDWQHRVEKFSEAVDAGAVGFIFRNDNPGCLPPTGEIGFGDRPSPIPAVGVSAELGHRLQRACPTSAIIEVDCEIGSATSQNVAGILGPRSEQEVLVTAHHDAHDIAEGANDNGSGAALMVAVADLLADIEEQLETQVRFVGHGSEEIGLHGARNLAESIDLETVKCVINLDVAGRSRTPAIKHNGFDAISSGFESMADSLDIDIDLTGGITPHGDYWPFVARGVPAAMVHAGGNGNGRGWGHTHADTLDKLDRRDLRELTIAIAESVLEFASRDCETPHKEPETIRDQLGERYERELRLQELWPYEEEVMTS